MELRTEAQQRLLNAIQACHEITTAPDLHRFIHDEFQTILPHEHFIYCIARAHVGKKSGEGHTRKLVNISFPNQFVPHIHDADGSTLSPLFTNWLQTRQPQFCPNRQALKLNRRWWETLVEHNLQNAGGNGVRGIDGGAYFAFANLEVIWNKQNALLLELVTPHLYIIADRLNQPLAVNHQAPILSTRQYEVLKWIANGKSNWEIGMILNISERTVKTHTVELMRRLHASNRAHAVALALAQGIIHL